MQKTTSFIEETIYYGTNISHFTQFKMEGHRTPVPKQIGWNEYETMGDRESSQWKIL